MNFSRRAARQTEGGASVGEALSFGLNPMTVRKIFFTCAIFVFAKAAFARDLSYNRDVRPILSDNCFYCHGPDAGHRKAKLRLDVREEALKSEAFVPGDPDKSELVRRIFTKDEDDQMPPHDSAKRLTDAQKNILKEWIAQGAKYEAHWAYIAPAKPEVQGNGVDFLVRKQLKEHGLVAALEADRRTLARRLSFDLVGLPARPEEVEAFEKDSSANAYNRMVDRLLASEHYGERMAIGWLDVVRYADTIGYHSDNPRNIWPYRDYVIKSFNENKAFDVFTKEQIAGDLLPNSGLEQKVASAFNRLLLSTEEGGAQEKDYEARMLTDRVRAIGTGWLGQTIGCAQCHDHKFDPIKQRDFYAMGAFFSDIKEPIIGRREDGMLVPTKEQETEMARLQSEVQKLQTDFDGAHPELTDAYKNWQKQEMEMAEQDRQWATLKADSIASAEGVTFQTLADGSVLAKGKKPDKEVYKIRVKEMPNPISALRIDALPNDGLPAKGPGRSGNGNFVLSEVVARVERANGDRVTIPFSSAKADFEQKDYPAASVIDGVPNKAGWAVLPEVGKQHRLVLEISEPVTFKDGDAFVVEMHFNYGGTHSLGRFRVAGTSSYDLARKPLLMPVPQDMIDLLTNHSRTEEQERALFAKFKATAPELADLRKQIAEAQKAKDTFEKTVPRCLVSIHSEKPRTVRILPRGNFLIETGEIVAPALPGYLRASSNGEQKLTRLDLANWLASKENPLTARVFVNRLWKQFFGIGLSKVLDDLGSQGEPPVNPELLDWLASEFMDSGWDIKHMVRVIVTSDTYKQISIPPKELRARDPFNREVAVQGRWRLDAELVRDNALAISGLLSPKIGGPSVKPYQPDGYWENLNFPVRTYEASKGEDQYRRGLYTWWQRSYMHPSLLAFDAPTREECVAERNRSTIPQQALALLNDPTYVEASRVFATRILKSGAEDDESRLRWAWRQALCRAPSNDEVAAIKSLLSKHRDEYAKDTKAAHELVSVGFSPVAEGANEAELAAWTNVARAIFNLYENVTRS
jgi:hypothetical protein